MDVRFITGSTASAFQVSDERLKRLPVLRSFSMFKDGPGGLGQLS